MSTSLSAEDLKEKLYQKLNGKGIINSLKCQLRNNLVAELQRSANQVAPVPVTPEDGEEGTLLHKAANSLVADHLNRCHYDYTLGVFLPESGTSWDMVFSIKDLLQLLNISEESKLYVSLTENMGQLQRRGFLWHLLTQLASCHACNTSEAWTQTDSTPDQEKMIAYQRRLEQQSSESVSQQVAQFRKHELTKAKTEEKRKCRKEIEKMKLDLEESYQVKVEALQGKEQSLTENIRQQQEVIEHEINYQRQLLEHEIQTLRQREAEFRRLVEGNNREKTLHEEKLVSMEQTLRQRELAVRQKEVDFDNRLQMELERFKIEELRKLLDRQKDVDIREARIIETSRQMELDQESLKKLNKEVLQKTSKISELEAKLQHCQHEQYEAGKQVEVMSDKLREMVDYRTLREDNAVLKRDIDHLKTRISESNHRMDKEREKYEDMLKSSNEKALKPSPEVAVLQIELQRQREALGNEQLIQHQLKQQHDSRLKDEAKKNANLIRKIDEQAVLIAGMNRDINDLMQQLQQTQQALNNELYKSKVPSKVPQLTFSPQHGKMAHGVHYGSPLARVTPPQIETNFYNLRHHQGYDRLSERNERYTTENTGAVNPIRLEHDDESQDESNSTMEIVKNTRQRLQHLDQEANNLAQTYKNFQHQHKSSQSDPNLQPPAHPRSQAPKPSNHHVTFLDSVLHRKSTDDMFSHVDIISETGQHEDTTPCRPTPAARALSSTPCRSKYPGTDEPGSSPTHPESEELPSFAVSRVTDVSPELPQDNSNIKENRPIRMSDLDARPGSPSLLVLPGSQSNKSDSSPRDSKSENEVNSLEEDIPSGNTNRKVIPDNKQDDREKEDRRREEEDRKWEEDRKRRQEERLKKELEERERQRRELEELQRQQEITDVKEATTTEDGKPEEESRDAESDDIDPVMQQYMSMLQQKKDKDTKIASTAVGLWNKNRQLSVDQVTSPPPVSDEEISVKDSVKSNEDDSW